MRVDFSKIGGGNTSETALQPREIFTALPGKKEGKFDYPRDVQTQVWEDWFSRKDEQDLVIKMNTGSGKTVVGLLILKSCLNQGKGPAVYVVPDNYLVQQVTSEAKNLGIEATDDVNNPRFQSGKSILVINIYKLVNGLSVFGVGDEGKKIDIGSIVVDDAHACLDTIEDQFTLKIERSDVIYDEIYNCFKDALLSQCQAKAIEIENRDLDAYMAVPFWNWQDKILDVTKILLNHKNESSLRFIFPLIKENLLFCRCVFGSNQIEISPHCIPIDMIPSVTSARRRIFMTATLINDSVLASHFGVTEESINKAVMPKTAGDIGDRLILLPQVINPEIRDIEIRDLCKSISENINVVVIVPSKDRAKFWKNCSNLILDKNNLAEGIARLKSEKVGLVVLINRYDGVDLPKEACRLLVIDGLPNTRRLIDKVTSGIIMGSSGKAIQLAQTIEQGMGRGIRSNDDHCAVILMGKSLTSQLYAGGAISRFSPGTKAQINLSEQIADQIKGGSISDIKEVLMYCLLRKEEWVAASKGVLASLIYENEKPLDRIALAQRKAYDFALVNNFTAATGELEAAVKATDEKLLRGYLKQCLAEYVNLYDKAGSQKILMAAASENPRITKPIKGIAYHKLESAVMDQARLCSEYLKQRYDDPNKIVIEVNGLIEALKFKPGTANIFEESFKDIARYLGFNSQRPEAEYGKGPDVLWEIGGLKYYVIECKNGAVVETICKRDCNQLNGSGQWFSNSYDQTCFFVPILVHPSTIFEYAASPHENTRIMNQEKLELFCGNVINFIRSVCMDNSINNEKSIREKIIHCHLRADDFIKTYTTSFSIKKT